MPVDAYYQLVFITIQRSVEEMSYQDTDAFCKSMNTLATPVKFDKNRDFVTLSQILHNGDIEGK